MSRSSGGKKRTSVVELIVDEKSENSLRLLCSLSSKLWNEVNYARGCSSKAKELI